jgi:hypothetical protein
MRDAGPTRAALLEMQEERRALHEGVDQRVDRTMPS